MMYEYERSLAQNRGFEAYCGTDEAGRGPLAGPVYAAAVYLGETRIDGLNDSKKLSEKKREYLFDIITGNTVYAIAKAGVDEIESLNILGASQLAMKRAVGELCTKVGAGVVLVDGNVARGFHIPAICVVGGDAKCASIAAASILAKVSRDREMEELDKLYPQYGFAKHKGYPTKQHYEALRLHGPLPIHRMSFLKNLSGETEHKNSDTDGDKANQKEKAVIRGHMGEDLALEFLERAGYTPVDRNFRSYAGEIDLIVKKDGYIVFTEVKLRKNSRFADASEYVDRRKIEKLKKTAEYWLIKNHVLLQPRFDVIEVYLDGSDPGRAQIRHITAAF